MNNNSHLQAVPDPAELPIYPIASGERLESHYFIAWERRRWLNSDMRIKGTPECRALYLDLIFIAYDQAPIGTLPDDLEVLARLTFTPVDVFTRLCGQPFGPLHRWERCVVPDTDEIRLMHPMVIQTLGEAIARKETNRAHNEAGNTRQRLGRLRSSIAGLDVAASRNDYAVKWIDGYFTDNQVTYRDAKWIERGLRAFGEHMLLKTMGKQDGGRD